MNDDTFDTRDISIAFLTWELAKALHENKRLKQDVKDFKADNARISAQWDRLRKEVHNAVSEDPLDEPLSTRRA